MTPLEMVLLTIIVHLLHGDRHPRVAEVAAAVSAALRGRPCRRSPIRNSKPANSRDSCSCRRGSSGLHPSRRRALKLSDHRPPRAPHRSVRRSRPTICRSRAATRPTGSTRRSARQGRARSRSRSRTRLPGSRREAPQPNRRRRDEAARVAVDTAVSVGAPVRTAARAGAPRLPADRLATRCVTCSATRRARRSRTRAAAADSSVRRFSSTPRASSSVRGSAASSRR